MRLLDLRRGMVLVVVLHKRLQMTLGLGLKEVVGLCRAVTVRHRALRVRKAGEIGLIER